MAPSTSLHVFIHTVSPGYYNISSHVATRPRGRFRTDLLDILEAAAYLPKEKLAPLMEYFKKAVDCKRRCRLPTPKNNQPGQEAPSQRPTAFTLFPELPLELRNMVWKRALPGARILEMPYFGPQCLNRSWDAKRSQRAVLNIAKCCTEAKMVVAKCYVTLPLRELQGNCFSHCTGDSGSVYQQQTYFVDYQQDIFYLPWGDLCDLLNLSIDSDLAKMSRVTQMAISIRPPHYFSGYQTICPKDFEKLKALRNVIFIGDCERVGAGVGDPSTRFTRSELEALDREDALPIHRTEFEEERIIHLSK
ncbi:hypothetical protein BKA61DRAFT_661113 [Leptodontidium sp. MPI-SDFR-AT-0119]|nr:hypothetical protein BKA61DRAFT_661113 [Leptodontidium sp. MPI-SDFR-AT-0119]